MGSIQYIIKDAVVKSGNIAGYEVLGPTGKTVKIVLKEAIDLVEKGVTNCKIVKDSKNEKHIHYVTNKPDFNEKASIENDNTTYKIEARLIKNGKVVGYKCRDSYGDSQRLRPNSVWELARKGKIPGVEGICINKKMALIGKDFDLSKVKIVQL